MIALSAQLDAALAGGGTVLVPSRRHAHAVRMAVAARALGAGRRVWPTPDVLAADGWLRREYDEVAARRGDLPRLLAPAEEWYLWRECTAAALEDPLLAPARLGAALQEAAALADTFGITGPKAAHGSPELALYLRVRRAVEERARAAGALCGPAALARVLAPALGSRPAGRIALCGFVVPPPLLRQLDIPLLESSGAQLEPTAVVASDAEEELDRITAWCAQRLARRPQARLLVVLPGSPALRERLALRIAQALDPRGWLQGAAAEAVVRTEGAEPLLAGALAAEALLALRFLTGEPLELTTLCRLLRSRCCAGAPGARAALELWLRGQGAVRLDHGAFLAILERAGAGHAALATQLRRCHRKAAQRLEDARRTLPEWSERFRDALDTLGWPGTRTLSSPEQQLLLRVHELLDEFGQLAPATGPLHRDAAVRLLTELAERTRFRSADVDAPVTLAPELADPVVRYEGIWVARLSAEVLPRPADPNPFLPQSLQRAHGVPAASALGRLLEAQRLLLAWRSAAADELVLSTARRDADIEVSPSPLLRPFLPGASAARGVSLPWLALRLRRGTALESLVDACGAPWDPTRDLPGGTRSLELQNECPFRAYAELRLGSGEVRESAPGVAPDARGRYLHLLLQRVWSVLGGRAALDALTDEALEALILEHGRAAVRELSGHDPQDPACPPMLRRELRRASELVLASCALERKRSEFLVSATESDEQLTLAGARMRVRIDRIDALPDGTRVIIDYKTGRRRAMQWYAARPSHPQLLAYGAALGGGVAALATLTVSAREQRFDGIARASGLLHGVASVEALPGDPDGGAWSAWQERWRATLEALVRGFLAGEARVDPRPGACQYCHARAICRIGLAPTPAEAGSADGPGGEGDD